MRVASPSLSAEELHRWLAEAEVGVEARDLEHLRSRLDAMRDRIRAATPQARSAVVRGYVRELSKVRPHGVARAAPTRGIARGFQRVATPGDGWHFPFVAVIAWVIVALLTVVSARADRNSSFSTWFAVALPAGPLFIPCFGVLAGAAHAGVECGRARVRSGRAIALLASVVAFALAMTLLYVVLDARRCTNPGISFLGAVGVGMGGLVGIVSAERGGRDWQVAPGAVALSAVFGYMYAVSAVMGCSR